MKKTALLLSILVIAFIGIWILKLNTPLTPSDPYASGLSGEQPWWERLPEGTAPTPDDAWILDPEIPANYIPVLNGNELYMVINEDGKIIKYRQRTRQDDGSWVWEDIDPNIPENYVAVEGLDNVYRVDGTDGSVKYYKYTRNDDDTYYFTEVDKNGNPLKSNTPEGNEIPPNYVRVDGNIYAVYNEYGVLIGYKERVLQEDGTYAWIDAAAPQQNNGQSNGGGIPGVVDVQGNGSGGDIYIITGGDSQTKTGYQETNTFTETVQENGWTIVYETTITSTYDLSGNLISTKKDGPTEINRFPTTSINSDILP